MELELITISVNLKYIDIHDENTDFFVFILPTLKKLLHNSSIQILKVSLNHVKFDRLLFRKENYIDKKF